MKKTRIGINGFGRIGRIFFRQAIADPGLEIVAINDPHEVTSSAHLLKYDSNYGIFPGELEVGEDSLTVNGNNIAMYKEMDPKNIPWGKHEVDIVVECTGVFRDMEKAGWHIQSGAKKVIISAPSKGDVDNMICMGVNEESYDAATQNIISNASCTTNSLAPVVKTLHQKFGIKRGFMTTVHSYTNDQSTLDAHHSDPRRARTAASSIIPTSTGAAEAVSKVFPELEGKLTGISLRVPTTVVSVTDFVVELNQDVTVEEVNKAFEEQAKGHMKGVLDVSYEPLVSVDYRGNPYSSIVDALSTMVLEKNLVKILAWYDNEWGYSKRLVDLANYMGKSL